MENTSFDVNEGSSASTETDNSSDSIESALAGGNFVEAAKRFVSDREKQREKNPEDEDYGDANPEDDISDPDSTRKESKDEVKDNEPSPGIKRRIDGLTAKFKSEQVAHKQAALENAKLKEAVRLYAAEIERLSARANLDPHEEEIHSMRMEREIDQIQARIPGEIEGRFSQAEQEMVINERAQEIGDSIRSVTAQWDGLFTARELAAQMKSTGNLDAEAVARSLGEARLGAAQKRLKIPSAPRTAGASASGAREGAQPWRYEGASTIRDFIISSRKARGGR